MNTFEVDVGGRTYEVDAPDEGTAWKWANAAHKEAGVKREAAVKADADAEKARFEKSESERSWGDRAIQNLGAGFDTARQGARQLGKMVGIGEGVSDEELQDTRRLKRALAERTTGGGLAQIAGEVLPTVALPMGAAGGLAKAAMYGAGGGAVAGALQPTLTDESRLGNMAFGAAGGAVAPVAVRGLQKALPRALGGRGDLSTSTRAGKRLVEAVGEPQAGQVASRLEAPMAGRITENVPRTAAQKAGSPELARLELAARRELPDEFAQLARRQNEAVHEAAVGQAGIEGTDRMVQMTNNIRDSVTAPLREEALGLAGKFSDVGKPLLDNTAEILQRTAKGSPANTVAKYVDSVLGENPNPQQLYDLRKTLVRKLSGPHQIGDEISAAVKGAERETMTLVRAIDERLNEAAARKGNSGDLWTKYLDRYTEISPQVTSARAQQQINEFINQPGRPLVGDAPEVTRTVLKQALAKHGGNKFGTRLTDRAQSRYDELLGDLQQMEEPMRALKLGGTGGGGSQTAMQSAARAGAASKVPVLGGPLFDMLTNGFEARAKQEVSEMMLDPARAAAGIRRALQAGQPLSRSEQAFLMLSRSGVGGSAAALTAQPATQ
jgi:hypothetical protein